MPPNYDDLRTKMVREQLIPRKIQSEKVLNAMQNVPRHLFVPKEELPQAYADVPLSIGHEQTISQPYIVAFMTEQLEPAPGIKILEIGTGSGYQAAILSYLGCKVFSIERIEALVLTAEKNLTGLGFNNIHIKNGNGYSGWSEEAPFDAIIVTAAPDSIPQKLIEQLKNGGKMILPVGKAHSVQSLKLITKLDNKITEKELLSVRFVPMVKSPI